MQRPLPRLTLVTSRHNRFGVSFGHRLGVASGYLEFGFGLVGVGLGGFGVSMGSAQLWTLHLSLCLLTGCPGLGAVARPELDSKNYTPARNDCEMNSKNIHLCN